MFCFDASDTGSDVSQLKKTFKTELKEASGLAEEDLGGTKTPAVSEKQHNPKPTIVQIAALNDLHSLFQRKAAFFMAALTITEPYPKAVSQ